MRIVSILVVLSCCLMTSATFADEMGELKEQMNALSQTVKDLKNKVETQQNAIETQRWEINSLKETVNIAPVTVAETDSLPASVSPTGVVTQEQVQQFNKRLDQVAEAQKKTLISESNLSIGAVGESIFSYRTGNSNNDGDSRPGGFDVYQRSMKLEAEGSVDRLAKAYIVINGSADSATSNAIVDVQEAAIQTTSLPWDLTLTGGRFFAEFGKLANIYDYKLPFVPRPLVLERYIGGKSQTDGVQLGWRLPTEQYINITAGLGDKFGNPPNDPGNFRNADRLNFFGHLAAYFDVTPNWHMETGLSGLINPRTKDRGGEWLQPGGSTLTEKERLLTGVDFSLCYTPSKDDRTPTLTWGNEVLFSDNRYDDKPVRGNDFYKTVRSVGLYSYLAYRVNQKLTAGFLLDFCQNEQNNQDQTSAYSPYLTYDISPSNKLRLEYTHTAHNSEPYKDDDAIYLQWVWTLGSNFH